jgi:hypothetical protein
MSLRLSKIKCEVVSPSSVELVASITYSIFSFFTLENNLSNANSSGPMSSMGDK